MPRIAIIATATPLNIIFSIAPSIASTNPIHRATKNIGNATEPIIKKINKKIIATIRKSKK